MLCTPTYEGSDTRQCHIPSKSYVYGGILAVHGSNVCLMALLLSPRTQVCLMALLLSPRTQVCLMALLLSSRTQLFA